RLHERFLKLRRQEPHDAGRQFWRERCGLCKINHLGVRGPRQAPTSSPPCGDAQRAPAPAKAERPPGAVYGPGWPGEKTLLAAPRPLESLVHEALHVAQV